MDEKLVEMLAADVVERLEAAKRELVNQMRNQGLLASDGWRISEELRHTIEGTEWIFRPIHFTKPAPDLEVSVWLDHEGRLI